MKWNKSLIKFGIIAIGICSFLICGFNRAEGAEWKLYQATSVGNIYYYDSTSIKHLPNDFVQVVVRIIETTGFSEEELNGLKDPKKTRDVIEKARKRSTGEWKQVFEINCSQGMFRISSATSYDRNGNIKDDYEIPSEWLAIPPNSVTNHLSKMICP
jgi:hypothetical protein